MDISLKMKSPIFVSRFCSVRANEQANLSPLAVFERIEDATDFARAKADEEEVGTAVYPYVIYVVADPQTCVTTIIRPSRPERKDT